MARAITYILDTNVLVQYARASILGKRIENRFGFTRSAFKPLVSIVTIGEIKAFSYGRGWGPQKMAQLDALLSNVVPIDLAVGTIVNDYAELKTYLVKIGKKIPDNDLWIAATCRALMATLITTDNHFAPFSSKFFEWEYYDPKS